MKQTYTAAILDLIDQGIPVDDVLRDVQAVMARRGHTRLYAQVLRTVARMLSARAARAGVTVAIARSSDAEVHAAAIKEAVAALASEGTYTTTVDPTLIGGFVARSRDRIIDASYKTALLRLYRSIIH